ncbi:hypothetical protein [Curtobacterium sp. B18]|uniref:hypothetical protein n=1 Tax=Curtobacterium sp. B18 TaxID=95614 RepID=UPI0003B506E2|nr:hypothetical protein [Curtobacterium sp. B18]
MTLIGAAAATENPTSGASVVVPPTVCEAAIECGPVPTDGTVTAHSPSPFAVVVTGVPPSIRTETAASGAETPVTRTSVVPPSTRNAVPYAGEVTTIASTAATSTVRSRWTGDDVVPFTTCVTTIVWSPASSPVSSVDHRPSGPTGTSTGAPSSVTIRTVPPGCP